ncbi:MAG: sugar ABC transporter permease [Amaricoccus sp.]
MAAREREPASVLDSGASGNLLFVLPGLAVYAVFVFLPIVAAVVISLTDWNGLSRPTFIGAGNYLALLDDPGFYTALGNSAKFLFFYCVLPIAAGLLLAAMVGSFAKRERLALRTFYFMPYVMPTAVLGIIFQWLYNPAFGPFNQFLKAVGLGALAKPWLGDPKLALPAVGMVVAWYFFGFCMVVFLTGMQRTDPTLHDAAKADGANAWQDFRHVTVPDLKPELRLLLLLTVIFSIKNFDLIFTMTRGGPGKATLVPNIYMYELGFHLNRFGYAAAVAIVGAALVLVVNFAIDRAMRDRADR